MTEDGDNRGLLTGMVQATRNLSTTFDAHLRTGGLTAARGRVLLFLAKQKRPVGQSEITAFLRVEGPTAVRILDGLEAQGLVRRMPDPNDRRAKLVALTEAGRPRAEEVVALTRRLEAAIMAGIEPEDAECATRVVDRIIDNIALANAASDPLRLLAEVTA